MTQQNTIIVLGGKSLVTRYLVKQLDALHLNASVMTHEPAALPEVFGHIPAVLMQSKTWQAPEHALIISLLPLNELVRYLPRFANAQSIIALGSTSLFSKAKSRDPYERAHAENLAMSENILRAWCQKNQKVYTILRPTLIYDGQHDDTVMQIAQVIVRAGLFPLAGAARGLRQPIHADDVAKAIIAALGNVTVYNKALNIAGGEVLTYRHMVESVFQAIGQRPRFLRLPLFVVQGLYRLARKTGFLRGIGVSAETFRRMNQDIVFDTDEGLRLLAYEPRMFAPVLKAA